MFIPNFIINTILFVLLQIPTSDPYGLINNGLVQLGSVGIFLGSLVLALRWFVKREEKKEIERLKREEEQNKDYKELEAKFIADLQNNKDQLLVIVAENGKAFKELTLAIQGMSIAINALAEILKSKK